MDNVEQPSELNETPEVAEEKNALVCGITYAPPA